MMSIVKVLSLVLLLPLALSIPLKDRKCGHESCPTGKDDMINVHIVCHTHNDMGWLKTVDQYYYGAKQGIQNAGVQYILDSVVQELIHDPNKRFIYVETGFFFRWWREQEDTIKHQVQELVRNGQLEFISGGWCMNDEATAYYNDIIDQMSLGFRFLNDTFGECGRPKIGWQIDPFGHSREQASLFAQMNFDGLFLGRIDYEDKKERQKSKNMEFIWNSSPNLGDKADLFTGILPNTYSPPDGFCFDIFCSDEPIMDDPDLKDYNVDRRVDEFLQVVYNQSKDYATNNLIITMGNDFNYQNAHTWYKNLDKLIKYVNERQTNDSKVNIFYSTPSCYLHALRQSQQNWSNKTDDFFPYASDPHAFWTGYFSSRPTVKGYVRATNNFLQVCKQLDALAQLGPETRGDVQTLREAQGVAQHHDAVSGTEKQAVAYDYAERLSEGVAACQLKVNEAYKKLIPKEEYVFPKEGHVIPNDGHTIPDKVFCNLLNISQCEITERNKPIAITLYNPLSRNVTKFVRLPVTGKCYKLIGPKGEPIPLQLVPIPDAVLNIPGRQSKAVKEVVFQIEIPPLGFKTVFLKPSNNSFILKTQMSRVFYHKGYDAAISNSKLGVVIDGHSGQLKEVLHIDGRINKVSQSFHYYRAMNGDNKRWDTRASGAYIFRPNGTVDLKITSSKVIKGKVVEEVHQTYNDWVSQVIRVYQDQEYVEFEWIVGPIPVDDRVGKEVISRFDSKIISKSKFYTDSNGRETLERIRDFRPTFKLNMTEPTSENYYPVNTHIYLKGSDCCDREDVIQMTILPDRAQGGSSAFDGSLELMVHRRLLHDDAFGVGEPLDEPGFNGKGLVALGRHYLIIQPESVAADHYKLLSLELNLQPSISFSEYEGDERKYLSDYTTEFSGLQRSLPPNVHMLTLEQWKAGSILMRLEHRFEINESPGNFSNPVTVSLEDLFTTFDIVECRETTLGANQFLEYDFDDKNEILHDKIVLNPMQIRTFLFKPRAKHGTTFR